MTFDESTRAEIEKKAKLFDLTKERAASQIKDNIRTAIDKLRAAEKELLAEVELEFGKNPFAAFLASANAPTDDEVKKVLSKPVPQEFGPSEDSFCSLVKEIESFKSWKKKKELSCFDLIPQKLRCSWATCDAFSLSWDAVTGCGCEYFYKVKVKSSTSTETYNSQTPELTVRGLEPETAYTVRVRAVTTKIGYKCLWSDPIRVETKQSFSCCGWKECPAYVEEKMRYSVDESKRVVTKVNATEYCTVIGSTPLPQSKVASWSVKILKSKDNDGNGICVSVVPSDVDQNRYESFNKFGWHFGCYESMLWSGPPHNYRAKEYGSRKEVGKYARTGDVVGVIMDTTKGELSFTVNGVNLGVAFEGVPLDKPLVPCVVIKHEGDSVELIV